MENSTIDNWSSKQLQKEALSPTATIVTKLLGNENREMLQRLSIKLGISNEEVYKLASEL